MDAHGVVIVPMKQITSLACAVSVCAVEQPDEFVVSIQVPAPGFNGNKGPFCADLPVMIRRHCEDGLILVPFFTGGSILMFGP